MAPTIARLLAILLAACHVHALDPSVVNVSAADIIAGLQPVVKAMSIKHNVSFAVGVVAAGDAGPVSVQFGLNDRSAGVPLLASDRFPLGSVTKSWTATAVMRMYERGLLDIDAPISRYVDPILQRDNGTTMLQIWGGDVTINNVTARQLMAMRGGLNDYDDQAYRAFVFAAQGCVIISIYVGTNDSFRS